MPKLSLNKDGKLAVPEANVQRTCIEWMALEYGYRYVPTNASDVTRGGHPAHTPGTLDGLFVDAATFIGGQYRWFARPTIFVEWKARDAETERKRREQQAKTARELIAAGFQVVRMPDKLLGDPIEWFQQQVRRLL